MPTPWPALPPYEEWRATRDTLHAHTQVLGKLAATLAPPEPQLQHAALRLSARGWETGTLPAPDGSGALVVALDLHAYEAIAEHSDGRAERVPLTPDRPVGDVTRDVLAAVRRLGGPVEINLTPQETPWTTPLDEDVEHATFATAAVDAVLRGRDARGARVGRRTCAVPRPLHPRQRLVGVVRPGSRPLLRPARGAAGGRLHHPQRRGCRAGRDRLVAWRCALPEAGVLRLRLPPAGWVRERRALTGRGPLGREARRVHPRLGRHPRRPGPARARAPVRASRRSGTPARSCGWDPTIAASPGGVPPPVR